jgi:hypothetical protein
MITKIPEDQWVMMTEEEISKKYDGKWVLLIQASRNPLLGVPVFVADWPYEKDENGVDVCREFLEDADPDVLGDEVIGTIADDWAYRIELYASILAKGGAIIV